MGRLRQKFQLLREIKLSLWKSQQKEKQEKPAALM